MNNTTVFTNFVKVVFGHNLKYFSKSKVKAASRRSALISASQPIQPGIQHHRETTNAGQCITQYACLLPSFRWVLILA